SLSTLNAGQALVIALGMTAMLLLAGRGVVNGDMTVGDFVMVNAYMMQLFMPLRFLGFVYRQMKQAFTDMERMFGLLEQRTQVADPADARPLAVPRGEVRFENLRFSYGSGRGAGKSTLARLLFRFYDADAGRILVDGEDIRDVTRKSLRRHIGVVPQDTVLFNDTLAYNIAYGRPDATADDVARAARMAHLDAFVASLPQGYDTPVGERDMKLSGGEKQRVAIARAILKNPPILIFDEATSSLDSRAEQAILAAMRELVAERTSLVIAHRLSTIVDADAIIVLDGGRIIERGTHFELLAAGGLYARLWALQQRDTDTRERQHVKEAIGR